MSFGLFCTLSLGFVQAPEQAFLEQLKAACASGQSSRVEALFARKADSDYLFRMAGRRGGVGALKVFVVEAPKDRIREGGYWAVFSARQDIEDDHDVVVPLLKTSTGFVLGKEIPEYAADPYRVTAARIDAKLSPLTSGIEVKSDLDLKVTGKPSSLVMRLNEPYELSGGWVNGKLLEVANAGTNSVARLEEGKAVKVGGIIILPSAAPVTNLRLHYRGTIDSAGEDKIKPNVAYVTGIWVPTIGRLPHPTKTRIVGPQNWVMVSEGEPMNDLSVFKNPFLVRDAEKQVQFQCDLPISYPKIIGGLYKLAGEKTVDGKLYQSYQLDPVEPERAKTDLFKIEDSIRWFEKNLGPFPFKRYACFDADTYYGIESYSYTLLRRSITTRFVTHEIGHTYFGGVAPCAYTRDSWNESLTQYVDSVLYSENRDGSLQAGLNTTRIAVPLSQMSIPHEYGSATYYRGAYVMKMLENEIGLPKVLEALQVMLRSRVGKDTVWDDLRPYFEATSGQELKWFWDQWIHAAKFPTVTIREARTVQREGKWRTFVTVDQSGTDSLYKLKFKVVAKRFGDKFELPVSLAGNRSTFTIDTDVKPDAVTLDVFGWSLVTLGPEAKVTQ